MTPTGAQPNSGALLRVIGALEALMELAKSLPSPMPVEDGVPLINRAQVLAQHAYNALDDERAEMLLTLVGDDVLSGRITPHSAPGRSMVAVVYGYLRGCVAELDVAAQREANAAAYAEAKIREERGVGFRSSGG